MKSVVVGGLLVLVVAFASAQDRRPPPVPNRTATWTSTELRAADQVELPKLAKQPGGSIQPSKQLIDVPTHRMSLVYRPVNGFPEVHAGETDVWIIQSGSGGVIIGGEIVGRGTGAGAEGLRNATIRGGQTFKAVAGDVFNIPPDIPHQALVDPGGSMSYLLIKVRVPPAQTQ